MIPRKSKVTAVILAVVVVGGAGLALNQRGTANTAVAATPTTTTNSTTAKVVRRDLVDTTTVAGTLTYGTAHALRVGGASGSSSGGAAGGSSAAKTTTVTASASLGTQVPVVVAAYTTQHSFPGTTTTVGTTPGATTTTHPSNTGSSTPHATTTTSAHAGGGGAGRTTSTNASGGNSSGGSGSGGGGQTSTTAQGSGAGASGGASATATTTPARVITALPVVGSVIEHGATLFEVNGAPGPALFVGPRPMWRTLQSGVTDGLDVLQLETNLQQLGFTDNALMTVDATFTSATTQAIKAWQTARGVTVTGTVLTNDVVYDSGPVRVATVVAAVGDIASGTVFQVTSTSRFVHVNLDPANEQYVTVGGPVNLTLPDSSTVQGTFTSLGTVANVTQSGNNTTTSVDLSIVIAKPPKNLPDGSPITVNLVTSRAKNVLSVPVGALLALAEGGFALEKVQADNSHSLVKIQTGKYAGGFVEVSGNIAEGDTVVSS